MDVIFFKLIENYNLLKIISKKDICQNIECFILSIFLHKFFDIRVKVLILVKSTDLNTEKRFVNFIGIGFGRY
jgi:hypothetical protein